MTYKYKEVDGRKWMASRRMAALAARREGLTLAEIGKRFDVTKARAGKIVQRALEDEKTRTLS